MRAKKHFIGMLALITSTSLIYQNCGNGLSAYNNSAPTSSANSSNALIPLPAVAIQIVPVQTNLQAGAKIDFNVSGVIPGDATYAWSNVNNGSSICFELSKASDKTYSINCASSGNALVTVAVIQQGQIVGSSASNFALSAAVATPTPSPTPPPDPSASPSPTPDPQVAVGKALYLTNCDTCHRPIATSNIRYTSAPQVTSVISGNLQNMHNTAGMTALIQVDAASVANLNALVFALGH